MWGQSVAWQQMVVRHASVRMQSGEWVLGYGARGEGAAWQQVMVRPGGTRMQSDEGAPSCGAEGGEWLGSRWWGPVGAWWWPHGMPHQKSTSTHQQRLQRHGRLTRRSLALCLLRPSAARWPLPQRCPYLHGCSGQVGSHLGPVRKGMCEGLCSGDGCASKAKTGQSCTVQRAPPPYACKWWAWQGETADPLPQRSVSGGSKHRGQHRRSWRAVAPELHANIKRSPARTSAPVARAAGAAGQHQAQTSTPHRACCAQLLRPPRPCHWSSRPTTSVDQQTLPRVPCPAPAPPSPNAWWGPHRPAALLTGAPAHERAAGEASSRPCAWVTA